MKKIYYMLMIAAMSMMMVSCSNWDAPYYYNDDISGGWVSEYGYDISGYYDLIGYEVVRYDFYGNHTGRYTYYSDFNYMLYYIYFDWDIRGNRLFIRYEDGDYDNLYFGYDEYGYLILSTYRNFYEYTAYRPAGIYYEPGKSLTSDSNDSPRKVTTADTVKVKSVTRAIKARVTDDE